MSDQTKWIIGVLGAVAVALVIAAGLSDDKETTEMFLGYLGGTAVFGFFCVMFSD